MALGTDGSVYVTGYSNGVTMFMPGQTNLLTVRYDASGQLVWSRLDISGTPGFFVNGRFLSGNQPLSAFENIIQEELKADQ